MTRFFYSLLLSFLAVHSRAFRSGNLSPGQGYGKTHYTCLMFASKGSPTIEIGFDVLRNKNVLVVGGNGRVGGSVVTQLLKHGAKVTVGGTRVESYEDSKRRWLEMFPAIDTTTIGFSKVDRERADSVSSVLRSKGFDLVVHTAGPFQGKERTPNGVIDASISNGVPYVDVCDDYCTARAAKTMFMQKAEEAEVPCIISTGCWVSWQCVAV